MPLPAGTRLGPYEIQSAIGAGGMGEVYRARDTRLDRTVAVKVLAPELAADPEFRARFEREARAISSLSHPHICVLHDIGRDGGVDYLVLEHLEGQTLAERLQTERAGLKLAEALRIATEIADGLDSAHRHGIVHRDLKPGNVMLTAGGAKLLDFGLAKRPAGAAAAALASLATRPDTATAQGTMLGTLQYMAPEQLQGRSVDARTDIFALGEIIFEMVTGRKPFEGQTQASVIAKILEVDPPPMSATGALSPPSLDRVVQRCPAKEPEERWQSARDVLLELRWIRESGVSAAAPAAAMPGTRGRRWLPWAVAAAALALTGASWLLRPSAVAADRPVVRFDVTLPPEMILEDWRGGPVLSPDGRVVVVPVAINGKSLLVARRLGDSAVVPIDGTEGAFSPFFSPSGRSLAFAANGKLKRIELAGGPAVNLADVPISGARGGTWSRDGTLLYAPRIDSGVFRVAESGGVPQAVTTLKAERGDVSHTLPEFLPDGRAFLFLVRGREAGIYVGSLDSTEPRRIMNDAARVHYAEPGYLVFQRGRTAMAVPFDTRRLEVSGPPFPIADQVFSGQYHATADGDLVYRFDGAVAAQLAWYARDGGRLEVVGPPGPYRQIALSPSGRRVAIQAGETVQGGAAADLLMLDLATGVRSRLTNNPALNSDPSWSPDERRLVFSSNRTGRNALFVKDLTTGQETPLFDFPANVVVDEWTPDGKFIVFRTGGRAIYALPMPGGTPRLVVDTPISIEDQTHLSPHGRWLAFNSDESGTWEVYVASFPDFADKQQISLNGGMQPVWRRDGRELFYLTPQGQLMAVEDDTRSATVVTGVRRTLFRTSLNPSIQVGEYAVSPDGQRFLILDPVGNQSQSISLLLNWPAKPR
jgi:Tol biopolymer transport system component